MPFRGDIIPRRILRLSKLRMVLKILSKQGIQRNLAVAGLLKRFSFKNHMDHMEAPLMFRDHKLYFIPLILSHVLGNDLVLIGYKAVPLPIRQRFLKDLPHRDRSVISQITVRYFSIYFHCFHLICLRSDQQPADLKGTAINQNHFCNPHGDEQSKYRHSQNNSVFRPSLFLWPVIDRTPRPVHTNPRLILRVPYLCRQLFSRSFSHHAHIHYPGRRNNLDFFSNHRGGNCVGRFIHLDIPDTGQLALLDFWLEILQLFQLDHPLVRQHHALAPVSGKQPFRLYVINGDQLLTVSQHRPEPFV